MMIRFDVSETAMWCLESDRRICLTSSLLTTRRVEWTRLVRVMSFRSRLVSPSQYIAKHYASMHRHTIDKRTSSSSTYSRPGDWVTGLYIDTQRLCPKAAED